MTVKEYIRLLKYRSQNAATIADQYRDVNSNLADEYDRIAAGLDTLISKLESLNDLEA